MMGVTHVTSGLLAALLAAPVLPPSTTPTARVVWITAAAGAALLPDLDTTASTAGRMWGPLSQLLARGIGAISGGHRWGTHDLILAPAGIWIAATAACASQVGALLLVAVTSGLILAALGLVGLGRVGAFGNLAAAIAATWCHGRVLATDDLAILPSALALGAIVHIAGDAMTSGKIPLPLLWLRRRRRIGIPLMSTGGQVEAWIVTPTLTVLTLWVLWTTANGAVLTDHASTLLTGAAS